MNEATGTMIKNCHACVLNQSLNKNVPLQPVKLPHGPWIKGAVDIISPMDGKYIPTYIDYYSSYPEAHVLKEITSSEVIRELTDIFSSFGFPEEIVSDNGKQYISAEFEAFLKSCGIRHIHASPYYACSNDKVEHFQRYLKKNFCAVIAEGKSRQRELPKILMSYWATPHPISGNLPAKLLFHHKIHMKVPHIKLSPDPQLE